MTELAKRMDVGAMEVGGLAVFGPKVLKILKISPGARESERVIEGITVNGKVHTITRATWEGARYLPPGRFDATAFPEPNASELHVKLLAVVQAAIKYVTAFEDNEDEILSEALDALGDKLPSLDALPEHDRVIVGHAWVMVRFTGPESAYASKKLDEAVHARALHHGSRA